MSRERYLSTEELLAEARARDIELSERTLRYYVSLGLLPRPGRHPSEEVDQRVLFFPAESLQTLEQIRRLKDSGFSLEQIRQYRAGTAPPGLEALAGSQAMDGSRLAERVVKALLSDEVREAYRDFVALSGDAPEEALHSLGKDFYRRVLSALVGREEADRTVARAFGRLTPAQWDKKLAPLRKMRETGLPGAPGPREDSLGRDLTSRIKSLAHRLLAGEPARSLEAELRDVAARIEGFAAKYAGVPPSNPQKHEIARFMGKALEVYGEAVGLLKDGAKSKSPAAVEQAISRAERAGEILTHLENMISEKRELLRLCQEEELRIP